MQKISNEYVRQHYDGGVIARRYGNEYEFNRWFSSSQARTDYWMTYSTILRSIEGKTFSRCLELGPGPGTWTRVLYRHSPSAAFDLVDISEEMHKQFETEMGAKQQNIRYIVSDIMEYTPQSAYDFFFSSRAFEYLDDKEGFVRKLAGFLVPGGRGVIITKNPLHATMKGMKPLLHTAQMSPLDLRALFERYGLETISCTPAVLRIGANIHGFGMFSVYLSEKLFRAYGARSLLDSRFLRRYAESYAISFRKSH